MDAPGSCLLRMDHLPMAVTVYGLLAVAEPLWYAAYAEPMTFLVRFGMRRENQVARTMESSWRVDGGLLR